MSIVQGTSDHHTNKGCINVKQILLKASDLFVRALENEGVKFIFGLPGEENIDLLDSLTRSDIKFITTRHEQGAAFMADVYGRLTGKPGVCLSTLGPGASNLVTGVANAHLDKVPIVALTGQTARNRLHKESHQNVDTLKLFSGITKYNQAVILPETIPEIVRKSFATSQRETPGASHIQLPQDVAGEDVEPVQMLELPIESKAMVSPALIKDAAESINIAKNPIILAGNGVIRSGAWKELREFVDATNIPIVSTFMAKGIVPLNHPRNLFIVGGKPYPPGMRPLHSSDLVIAVGFDLVEYDPVTWNKDRERKIINIHSCHAELDEHFPVSLDMTGSIVQTLIDLAPYVKRRTDTKLHDEIRERRLNEMTEIKEPSERIPKAVMRILTEDLPENTVLISDVGLHKVWVSRWYHPSKAGQTIVFNGFASMGGSLPGAIAAKLACPGETVVSVCGDGGFMMNVQELETAVRLGLKFAVVLFNDGKYSLIEKEQIDNGFKPSYILFGNPDFGLLARSFGIHHEHCETEEEFDSAVKNFLKDEKLTIIEVKR